MQIFPTAGMSMELHKQRDERPTERNKRCVSLLFTLKTTWLCLIEFYFQQAA